MEIKFPRSADKKIDDETANRTVKFFELINQATGQDRYCNKEEQEVLLELAKNGISQTATDESGKTALHNAIWSNNLEIINLLLDAGASVTHVNSGGRNMLLETIAHKNLPVLKLLVDRKVDLNGCGSSSEYPFGIAVNGGYFRRAGADKLGRFCLQTDGWWEGVKLMVDSGVDYTKIGWNRLHIAAMNGDATEVKEMLAEGVRLDGFEWVYAPAHLAAIHDKPEVLKVLMQNPADLEKEHRHMHLLHLAAANGSCGAINALIDLGANVNSIVGSAGGGGNTALCYAAENNKPMAVRILIINGAEVDVRPWDKKKTPLFLAVENECHEAAKVLLSFGANINMTNRNTRATVEKERTVFEEMRRHWTLDTKDELEKLWQEKYFGFYKSFYLTHKPPVSVEEVYRLVTGMPVFEEHGAVDRLQNLRKVVFHAKWESWEQAAGVLEKIRDRGERIDVEEMLQKVSFVRGWRERMREEILSSRRMV